MGKAKSWITSFFGILVYIVGLGNIAIKWHSGQHITQEDFAFLCISGAAGTGLMAAKDSNVTGAGFTAKRN